MLRRVIIHNIMVTVRKKAKTAVRPAVRQSKACYDCPVELSQRQAGDGSQEKYQLFPGFLATIYLSVAYTQEKRSDMIGKCKGSCFGAEFGFKLLGSRDHLPTLAFPTAILQKCTIYCALLIIHNRAPKFISIKKIISVYFVFLPETQSWQSHSVTELYTQ